MRKGNCSGHGATYEKCALALSSLERRCMLGCSLSVLPKSEGVGISGSGVRLRVRTWVDGGKGSAEIGIAFELAMVILRVEVVRTNVERADVRIYLAQSRYRGSYVSPFALLCKPR